MRHLNTETLARLLDEEAGPEERQHLESCAECTAELRALRRQTEALSALPEIRPPAGEWAELEARLREEGLVRTEERNERSGRGLVGLVSGPASIWLQAAAGLVLFLGGAGVGLLADDVAGPADEVRQGGATAVVATAASAPSTVDEAAQALRSAEERYVDAVIRYREMANQSDGGATASDPASRFAALETLMAASQAAIREAPTDPFLNGVLASTMAERQAVLRSISASSEENWF